MYFFCEKSKLWFAELLDNKKRQNAYASCLFARLLADSNRRTRFCRPLTKPLIQGALNSDKSNTFFENHCFF